MQVQQVVGDSFPDGEVAQLLVKNNFSVDCTIDALLASPRKPDKSHLNFFAATSATSTSETTEGATGTKRALDLKDATSSSSNGAIKRQASPVNLPNGK